MTNTASHSFPVGILSATAFTFAANAQDNPLQTTTISTTDLLFEVRLSRGTALYFSSESYQALVKLHLSRAAQDLLTRVPLDTSLI